MKHARKEGTLKGDARQCEGKRADEGLREGMRTRIMKGIFGAAEGESFGGCLILKSVQEIDCLAVGELVGKAQKLHMDATRFPVMEGPYLHKYCSFDT